MSEEQTVHPFIAKYRNGTTQRITNFDPLSKAFVDSVKADPKCPRSDGVGRSVHSELFNSVFRVQLSQLSQHIPQIGNSRAVSFGNSGRPWDEKGYIVTTVNTQTGMAFDTTSGTDTIIDTLSFDRAKLLLEYWTRREPQFETEIKLGKKPIKLTLINKFEAVPNDLICYSFLANSFTNSTYSSTEEQHIIHIWLNRHYVESGRQLPMYFEWGGSTSLYINAAISSLGFRLGPMGECYLEVMIDGEAWRHKLNRAQIERLASCGVVPHSTITNQQIAPHMMNANLEGLGFTLSANGRQWNPGAPVTNWQIGEACQAIYSAMARSGWVASDLTGTGKERSENPSRNHRIVAHLIAKAFWSVTAAPHSEFSSLIDSLRREVYSRNIMKEVRTQEDGISATELIAMFNSKSDDLGRFDFERNLPGEKPVEVKVADVEAEPSGN